jgi:hypothetical protein
MRQLSGSERVPARTGRPGRALRPVRGAPASNRAGPRP